MHLVPRLESGGMARHAADLAVNLARQGGRAVMVSEGGRLLPDVLRGGVTHLEMPVDSDNPLKLARTALKLARVARRDGIALIHARSATAAWTASLVKRFTGLPLVVTLDHRPDEAAGRRRWHARAIARADHVIATSNHMAAHAAADHGLPMDRLSVIPGGVNLTRFDPAAVHPDRVVRVAQRWLLPDGVPVILMPTRIAPGQGHEILIEALSRLGDRAFTCILAGDDKGHEGYRRGLEKLALDKGLAGKLRFVGFCEDMAAAYMLSDAVACPRITPRAFDLTAAEAQAMGRPVVGSAHGGLSELVLQDKTGWLVPPGDPDLLAEALDRAISLGAAARTEMALCGRERIVSHFSLDHMCARTLALYDMLLQAGPRAMAATA